MNAADQRSMVDPDSRSSQLYLGAVRLLRLDGVCGEYEEYDEPGWAVEVVDYRYPCFVRSTFCGMWYGLV